MTEFDIGLPSVRQVQGLIKDQKEVELKLTTGDLIVGKILWQDSACLCLAESHNNQQTLVWRQALVYLKSQS